ncbi:Dot/Icm secretion system substrate (plasmid) [Legionella adelaidensis]|uniref:Dot/Icm secretion system substrate n=1 Tax=Legionella adelaidensis TaxID=45056 RepID=A0A0W0R1M6_9GAMM|nr:hypothetical protein [Legionella adelaidensis]KTC64894.1 substrate of the Dot/Icm secretion system [Legionella adelaidensis]VEH82935.1 Dot/Icm secretion system substrate [Legionella adelaidensis]
MKANITMPSSNSLYAAMRVATTPEAADYLVQQFEQKLKDSGMYAQSQGLLNSLKVFAETVHREHDSSFHVWEGDKGILRVSNPQEAQRINNQDSTLKEYSKTVVDKSVDFGFAVNQESELRRGYSSDGKEVDEKLKTMLDNYFNAWVVNKDMAVLDGVVYEAVTAVKDEKGKQEKVLVDYKKDSAGNPIPADPDKVAKAILDKDDGLKAYVEKANPTIKLDTKQYAFPAPEAAPEKGSGMGAGG